MDPLTLLTVVGVLAAAARHAAETTVAYVVALVHARKGHLVSHRTGAPAPRPALHPSAGCDYSCRPRPTVRMTVASAERGKDPS